MKMSSLIVILCIGLVVCGCLVFRHHPRTPTSAAPVAPRATGDLRPVDAWQESIKLAPATNLDWREKLRREEQKQRPQEGRN